MELVFLLILIVLMITALIAGFPVAFALPGSAILAIGLAALCGHLFAGDVSAYFAQDGPIQWLSAGVTNFRSLYWSVERDTLIAIPFFIFMGIMLQRSKIAEDLLVAMARCACASSRLLPQVAILLCLTTIDISTTAPTRLLSSSHMALMNFQSCWTSITVVIIVPGSLCFLLVLGLMGVRGGEAVNMPVDDRSLIAMMANSL